MAPLSHHHSRRLDGDGPRSEIQGEDILEILRKYSLPPSMELRSPTDFERAPDGG